MPGCKEVCFQQCHPRWYWGPCSLQIRWSWMSIWIWEMKVLGLDEPTDYARDIFGPSWLKFDELRWARSKNEEPTQKIMSKPFEIIEHKCKPGNNPSLMHYDTHAKSLSSDIYSSPEAPQGDVMLRHDAPQLSCSWVRDLTLLPCSCWVGWGLHKKWLVELGWNEVAGNRAFS